MNNVLRNLNSYKEMHRGLAESKGVSSQFQAARTLTEARKVLFGEKKKQYIAAKIPGSNKK